MYKQMEPIFIFKKINKNLNINSTFAVICYFVSKLAFKSIRNASKMKKKIYYFFIFFHEKTEF